MVSRPDAPRPWFAEPASTVVDCCSEPLSDSKRPSTVSKVDCGYDGGALGQHDLFVNACGREIKVALGVTLLLAHVQRALQVELGMPEQTFDICDAQGVRLLTDRDLRGAVMAERTPLEAEVADSTARTMANSQEDMARIICHLVREHCTKHDGEIYRLNQEVALLRREVELHKTEVGTALHAHRNEVNYSIGALQDIVEPLNTVGKGELKKVLESSQLLASNERVTLMEHECKLYRLGEQVDEMTGGLARIAAEQDIALKQLRASAYAVESVHHLDSAATVASTSSAPRGGSSKSSTSSEGSSPLMPQFAPRSPSFASLNSVTLQASMRSELKFPEAIKPVQIDNNSCSTPRFEAPSVDKPLVR